MFHIILIIFFSKFHRTYFFLALHLWCTLRCDFLDSRILKYAAVVRLWASSCMILIPLDCLIKKHDRESFMNFQWEKWRDPFEETCWYGKRQISFLRCWNDICLSPYQHVSSIGSLHFSHWKFMKLSLSCFLIRQSNDIKIMQDDAHRWTSAAYFRILLSRKSQRSVHHRRKARKKYVLWNFEKKMIKIMWNKETRKY